MRAKNFSKSFNPNIKTAVLGVLLFSSVSESLAQIQFKGSLSDQISLNALHPELVDIDNDGDLDLLATDSLCNFYYQENIGNSTFFNFDTVQTNPFGLASIPTGGLGTMHFGDLDNDGDIDLLTLGDFGQFFYYSNTGTAMSPMFSSPAANPFGLSPLSDKHLFLADIDNDNDLDLFTGENNGTYYYSHNYTSGSFPAFGGFQTNSFGLVPILPHARPNLVDLDNDGDLDMFSATPFGQYDYYENVGTNTSANYGASQVFPFNLSNQGTASNDPAFGDLDDDGDFDFISKTGSGKVELFENIGTSTAALFDIQTIQDKFGLTTSQTFLKPSFFDLDNDGDLDALVGNINGSFDYFENIGSQTSPSFSAAMNNPFGLASTGGESAPCLVDMDGDGDADLFTGQNSGGSGAIIYFENTGTINSPIFNLTGTNPFGLSDPGSASELAVADMDNDGDKDILIGTENGNISYFENTGSNVSPAFSIIQINPFGFVGMGPNTNPTLTVGDIDEDGDLDLLTGLNTNEFRYYENSGSITNPNFSSFLTDPFGLTIANGPINISPLFVDIDGDLDLDVFAGAEIGTYYFENISNSGLCEIVIPDPILKAALLDHGIGITGFGASLIDANGNGIIECLEASNYTGSWFIASGSGVTDLTGVEAFTNLSKLIVSGNNLSSVDLSNNINLIELSIGINNLTSLDVTNNVLLEEIRMDGLNIGSINLTQNTALTYLSASSCQLTTIDLSSLTLLDEINLASNNLSNLSLTNNTNLNKLFIEGNQITTIDLTNQTAITNISAQNNLLTDLDVSNNIVLTALFCHNNHLTSLNVANGNNINMSFSALNNPNLNCVEVDDAAYSTINWTNIDPSAIYSEDCASIDIYENKLNLSIFPNPTDGIINVQLDQPIQTIELLNIEGQVIENHTSGNLIDITSLANGIYTIRITTNEQVFVNQIVKK